MGHRVKGMTTSLYVCYKNSFELYPVWDNKTSELLLKHKSKVKLRKIHLFFSGRAPPLCLSNTNNSWREKFNIVNVLNR